MRNNGIILPGDVQVKDGACQFECPVCHHLHSSDEPVEPMCTGPLWTDDHAPTIMVRNREKEVSHVSQRHWNT